MALTTGLASLVPLTAGSHGAGAIGGPFMFAPFGFLLVFLLVGTVGYVVLKSTRSGNDASETRVDKALETLRRRYANGEIDDEEFQTRKARLMQ
ncbi:MAG: SHOCT domain-containing protein [Haloarculaceae archaeon]